jgi:hypothetical protein
MNRALLLVLLVFACLARGFAASDIVYVAYNGADTNPCTRVSPCQTITHALSVVNAGGQVTIVGSGTYDNFTVGKAVTVAAEPGVVAVLDVSAHEIGITINAGANDRVAIRGLYLNGGGVESMTAGISVLSAGEVSIDNVVARNFDENALFVQSTVLTFVSVHGGVYATTPLGAIFNQFYYIVPEPILICCTSDPTGTVVSPTVAIDSVTVEDGCVGIAVDAKLVTVTNSLVSGGRTSNGNCDQQSLGPTAGISAAGEGAFPATVVLENNVISNYDQGLQVYSFAYPYLSSNIITGNSTGVLLEPASITGPAGIAFTRGNNTIEANAQNVAGTMTPFSGQ